MHQSVSQASSGSSFRRSRRSPKRRASRSRASTLRLEGVPAALGVWRGWAGPKVAAGSWSVWIVIFANSGVRPTPPPQVQRASHEDPEGCWHSARLEAAYAEALPTWPVLHAFPALYSNLERMVYWQWDEKDGRRERLTPDTHPHTHPSIHPPIHPSTHPSTHPAPVNPTQHPAPGTRRRLSATRRLAT